MRSPEAAPIRSVAGCVLTVPCSATQATADMEPSVEDAALMAGFLAEAEAECADRRLVREHAAAAAKEAVALQEWAGSVPNVGDAAASKAPVRGKAPVRSVLRRAQTLT